MAEKTFEPCPHGQFLAKRLDRVDLDAREALECTKAVKTQLVRVEGKVERMEKYDLGEMAADIKHMKEAFEEFRHECLASAALTDNRRWEMKIVIVGLTLNVLATIAMSLYFSNLLTPM